jgi:hypothetical protein
LRPKESDDPVDLIPDFLKAVDPVSEYITQKSKTENMADRNEGEKKQPNNDSAVVKKPIQAEVEENAAKPKQIRKPRFIVNDDSKIEVTMTAHEFETSMAKNDFSSQSTEGAV